MMRHTFAEGWLLLRHHLVVSSVLALALAVPLCLGGVTWSIGSWLRPIVDLSNEESVVVVLLHPQLQGEERSDWVQTQRLDHPEWLVRSVPPDQLADRLTAWFPYLGDVFEQDGGSFLPPLVEIVTEDPASIDAIEDSPSVIAIGPRSSVNQAVSGAAQSAAFVLGGLSAVLLAAAAALAAVWVHLGVYRHGDEITIMRLIGATESTIRGPFLVSVTVPGAVSGVVSCAGTLLLLKAVSHMTAAVGLPTIDAGWPIFATQCALGFALPLLVGLITLSRHAVLALES